MIKAELHELVWPPIKPKFPGSPRKWRQVETRLGITFPKDYKWYVDTYGEGSIADRLQVFNPFTTKAAARLDFTPESGAGTCFKILKFRRKAMPEHFPYPLFPEADGLLPCGEATRLTFWWLTKGHPDQWKLMVVADMETIIYDETLTTFLQGILAGRIKFKYMPRIRSKLPADFVVYP